MAQYPPPPQPDQQHYNALYPATTGPQQLIEPTTQEQLQYNALSQALYSKVDENSSEQPSNDHQIQHLAQELQHQAALEEQQRHQIQQAAQQIQHQGPSTPQEGPSHLAPAHAEGASSDQSAKANRLRKACDSCSIRKVKCDEAGPPCRACAALDIPCTFDRPSRRRGPPNRHAEAIKRRRVEDVANDNNVASNSSPSSPTHAAQALAALSSHPANQQLSIESICPAETLNLLIDDFFTNLYPLHPFPHELTFRQAWKGREDLNNNQFLALLASIVGAVVASLPRKARLYLKAQRKDRYFPNYSNLVLAFQKLCSVARGPGYLENENLTVYDAVTSYFLGLANMYYSRWHRSWLYFGECSTIIRALGLNRPAGQAVPPARVFATSLGSQNEEGTRADDHVDNITSEMGRRVFWSMSVLAQTATQYGPGFDAFEVSPPISSQPQPQLPAELDDFLIYPTHNEPQPAGLLPIVTGFNANVQVYNSYNALTKIEAVWGSEAIDRDRQKGVVLRCLSQCKTSVLELPSELVAFSNSESVDDNGQNASEAYSSLASSELPRDPASSLLGSSQPSDSEQTPVQRRHVQYETQANNVSVSYLSTRIYLVKKYWSLADQHESNNHVQQDDASTTSLATEVASSGIDRLVPSPPTKSLTTGDEEIQREHESIIKDLVAAFGNLKYVNLASNGDNYVSRLRSSTILALDIPDHRKGVLALQTQDQLRTFLELLTKLEQPDSSTLEAEPHQFENEEVESTQWAELRDIQAKFVELATSFAGVVGVNEGV